MADSELYLIAHKVRGAVAFDVAQQVQIGEELAWIIPTSGWRAYPIWQMPLLEHCLCMLADGNYAWSKNERGTVDGLLPALLPDDPVRDHFHSEAAARPAPRGKLTSLSLTDLGL